MMVIWCVGLTLDDAIPGIERNEADLDVWPRHRHRQVVAVLGDRLCVDERSGGVAYVHEPIENLLLVSCGELVLAARLRTATASAMAITCRLVLLSEHDDGAAIVVPEEEVRAAVDLIAST